MKKITLFFLLLIGFSALAQTVTIPSPALANGPVTINFNKAGTPLAGYTGIIYAHIGLTVNGAQWQNVKGTWNNNATQPALTLVSGTTYKLDLTPDLYTSFGVPTTSTITQICVVFRAATGSPQSADTFLNVGAFQLNLVSPGQNSTTILASGGNLNVTANNTGGNANYVLKANGTTINTATTASYTYNHTNITSNQNYVLEVTQGTSTLTKSFAVVVNPGALSQALPAGMKDGINYNQADPTKSTLVLNAPNKDFVYVAGSFNNYNPTSAYAMKKDPATGKFWLELTELTSGTFYNYQYWVGDQTNLPANSPALVKTADPFSTLVLSPFDDPEIQTLGVYPNLPAYPAGQEREVTVLQTGPNAHYNYTWSDATLNFVKPAKKDLVIYEVLVRDFDANRTYQNLIDRIDYFKNLKINAVQLMPVMEFEGNESWGYNTAYHMALDKRYGTEAKLKEFIDLCHQNGIAVILDVALNHVFSRSPLERMWMLDPDNDGWGNGITAENPYGNQSAMHSYNVGTDLNHFNANNMTQYYSERTIQHWMQEFKIDGFRWDLTKGFTQNCPGGSNQETCTNAYQADRVLKLKQYADMQWAIDPNFYVIFEHLGNGGSYTEEVEWANYRKTGDADGISKGILLWRKMTDAYANFLKGNSTNLSGVADGTNMFIGYAESHDEERVMYKAMTETGQTQNILVKAQKRMSAMGAVHLLVPGPKMIYHFGDLGYESSIFTCNNGTVNNQNDAIAGDCKLDTKPQPQWTGNWLANTARKKIYDDWAKMIELKRTQNVFKNGQHTWVNTTGKTRLNVFTSTAQTTELSYVIVMTNATNATTNDAGNFPFTGTWYNLMDGTPLVVTSTNQAVSIEADGFRVYGNRQAVLNTVDFNLAKIALYPNPSRGIFNISTNTKKVSIYSIAGQLVKEFKGDFDSNYQYEIESLNQGMYIVKVIDDQDREATLKLMKQ
ncbi:alpha-amylase family glycosyl hydrolase [Flavobacterium macacae]|uniref:T9SS C-terminal target domain-containing protein n=1 Tax=Flavobacterium macacae TaxID=2488993 RepID=A0A3P3WKW9_9FLAO|nr:alpha-amylase family glycosyl hydrolase [Flavobacterium macacae]RRJ93773.1 T9SS C-terminal target domain-containing protein [Flavobacterium macacae]